MAASFAYIDNTNSLTLTGLKSDAEDMYINDATVTVTIENDSDEPVTGQPWPLDMIYTEGSNGNYQLAIPAAMPMVAGEKYTAIIDVDASDTAQERIGHWEFTFTAKVRTA